MDGIIVALKPPGATSQNIVSDIRHIFDVKKAGHLGTLDPGAAGVLPIGIGRGARLFDLLVDKEKEYIAELCFGMETDTQDLYGKVVCSSEHIVTASMLESVLPAFRGEILQTAPAYSALKVDGKKMYDLARAGQAVPEKVRTLNIHCLEVLGEDTLHEKRFFIRVGCSRGTYIRTLCTDIGRALGVPAVMGTLIRTRAGAFTLTDSYSVPELEALKAEGRLSEAVVSCEAALSHFPELQLPSHRRVPTCNGLPSSVSAPDGIYRFYSGHSFLGAGNVSQGEARLNIHLYD